jgi:hypothetical protein
MTEILIDKNHGHFSPSFFVLRYQLSLLQPEQKSLVDELGMIRTQMESTIYHKIVAVVWDALYYTTPNSKQLSVFCHF